MVLGFAARKSAQRFWEPTEKECRSAEFGYGGTWRSANLYSLKGARALKPLRSGERPHSLCHVAWGVEVAVVLPKLRNVD